MTELSGKKTGRKGGRPGLVVEPVLLENEHKEDAICPER